MHILYHLTKWSGCGKVSINRKGVKLFIDGQHEKSFVDYGWSAMDVSTEHVFKIKTHGSSGMASIYLDDKEVASFDDEGLVALRDCLNKMWED